MSHASRKVAKIHAKQELAGIKAQKQAANKAKWEAMTPEQQKRTMIIGGIVIGVVVIFFVVAAIAGGNKGSGGNEASSGSSSGSGETMEEWASANAGYVDDMASALGDVESAANTRDADLVDSACSDMHDANEVMASVLPAPDPDMTAVLQSAISDFDESAHFCLDGDYEAAGTYVELAGAHMNEATSLVQSYLP